MIPLAKDTRECVGPFAEKVENRSLLFQKMVLSKSTLHAVDRFDDAQRFNVLRATHEGNEVLREEMASAQFKANSPRSKEHVKDQARYRAAVAGALVGVRVDHPQLAESRIRSNNRFLLALEASYTKRSITFTAALGGRLLVNMAGGVMENSGLALDRICGLPYIPGSAVKGVARHAALWEIRNEENPARRTDLLRAALAVFGFSSIDFGPRGDFLWAARGDRSVLDIAARGLSQEAYKGVCAFVAAQPVALENLRIVAEVLTPHVNNNLRPIFFPAVEAGSEFGFAIIGQREPQPEDLNLEALIQQAGTWLRRAITEGGIGAKTGAGYGWFLIDPQAEARRRDQLAEEARAVEAAEIAAAQRAEEEKAAREAEQREAERLASLSPVDLAAETIRKLSEQDFADFAKNLAQKDPAEQQAFLTVLRDSALKETRKRWKRRKPELWSTVAGVAQTLGTPLD